MSEFDQDDHTANLWTLIENSLILSNLTDLEYGLLQLQEILSNTEDIEQSLIYVLNLAFTHDQVEAIPLIITIWAENNVDESIIPTSTIIFLYNGFLPGFFEYYA